VKDMRKVPGSRKSVAAHVGRKKQTGARHVPTFTACLRTSALAKIETLLKKKTRVVSQKAMKQMQKGSVGRENSASQQRACGRASKSVRRCEKKRSRPPFKFPEFEFGLPDAARKILQVLRGATIASLESAWTFLEFEIFGMHILEIISKSESKSPCNTS
jgi:hypothetical protein